VAHDFNNLLTVIIGGLGMILKEPELPARARKVGEAALEAGRRGERITRQLLAFSRSQKLKLERVDLRGLVMGFEPLLRGAVSEEIALSVEAEPGLGTAMVDPVQLEAALLNLVVNAGDAIAGEGTIRVSARRLALRDGEVEGLTAGDHACIEVSDTGAGMTSEVAARAFEPFFTTKEVGKGSGLGLAQVYGVARDMSGSATVDSAPGRGTRMRVYIPLSVGPPADQAVEPARCVRPVESGCSVLLVEDDPGVRQIAESMLHDLGCEVTSAPDGPSALDALVRNPDTAVLISDVVMPGGMTGPEVARAALERRPDLKVILSTGYAADRLEGVPWPVLRKPFDADELCQQLRRTLEAPPAGP
jgi:CheY-like chemotaxis protein